MMKNRIKVTLAVAALTLFSAGKTMAQGAGTLELTLSKAIEIALAENPTMRVAEKEIKLKEIADKEAWQALLPSVDASLSGTHSFKVGSIKMEDREIKMGKDATTTMVGGITANIPLYAPTVYQNMKLSKTDIQIAQEQARKSRLDLINQVKKAYYAALLSQDSHSVMVSSHETAKKNYDVVSKKYEVGKVSEFDKLSAEVQMRATNSSVVSAKNAVTLAMLKLKVLMGVTANVDININDSLKAYEGSLLLPEDNGADAVENNSSLKELDLTIAKLQQTRKLLYTNFLPTIGAQLAGQYQSYSNPNLKFWDYSWSPGVTLALNISIPLYHASNFTKLKTNKMMVDQMMDTRENTRRNLAMAAESYRQSMISTVAKLESDREAVKQATKAVDISMKRYDVGRGTILETNQSEDAKTMAELTYNQGIYDYLSSKADLEYTLGME